MHADAKTHEFEPNPIVANERAMIGRVPFDGPLGVRINAVFPIPHSRSKKRKALALTGEIRPTVTPDWNNVVGITDGLNGACGDDRQIVEVAVTLLRSAAASDLRNATYYNGCRSASPAAPTRQSKAGYE